MNATATAERTTRTPTTLEPELLHDIARGIAQAEGLWRQAAVHDPDARRPTLLLATEAYEVWVIGWTRGQRADLHDHGPHVRGVLQVVEGTLTERLPHAGEHRTLPAGATQDLPVGLVHEVVNDHDGPATSIHVYSPPLRTMTRYDERTLRPTTTEILPHVEPTFAVPAERLLRHPSVG